MVTPLSFKSLKLLNNSSTSCGTSTAVGSSRIKIFAPLNRTFKISTLCFSPTPSSSIVLSKLMLRLYLSITSIISDLYLLKLIFLSVALSMPNITLSRTDKLSASMKC